MSWLGLRAALPPSHVRCGQHGQCPCEPSALRARAWRAAVSPPERNGDVGVGGGVASPGCTRFWGGSGRALAGDSERHSLPKKNLGYGCPDLLGRLW